MPRFIDLTSRESPDLIPTHLAIMRERLIELSRYIAAKAAKHVAAFVDVLKSVSRQVPKCAECGATESAGG
jgi:hypothetical protein